MREGAGAGLVQQIGQDLASCKCFSYTCCAPGGKSWLCRTHRAHRIEEAPCWKRTDSKEGTTDNTMARRTISLFKYLFVYTHTQMHVRNTDTDTEYTYTNAHTPTYTLARAHTHTHTHTHTCTKTHIHIHMNAHAHTHKYPHVQANTYIHSLLFRGILSVQVCVSVSKSTNFCVNVPRWPGDVGRSLDS